MLVLERRNQERLNFYRDTPTGPELIGSVMVVHASYGSARLGCEFDESVRIVPPELIIGFVMTAIGIAIMHEFLDNSNRAEDEADDDIRYLILVKDKERYIFSYDASTKEAALRTLGRFASNPELSFSWYDAAVLSQRIRADMEFRGGQKSLLEKGGGE